MATGKDEDLALGEVESTVEMAEALRASGVVDDLLAQVDSGEVALTGEGGLLPGLIKLALERGLAAELTDHLGYEKGDPAGRALPNARNGTSPKTVQTEAAPSRWRCRAIATARSLHGWCPRAPVVSAGSMT
ncbi:hypothetical protein MBOU_25350 [Mycobacterium bourgelatii]|uniref:IS256 family transposase n=1 Tax=Mycobacterium bourgelatii TaxID=1273442 RepID=A0A7I9YPU3_MYCBU|nr:hypothetical protein MBOU_25350 [Mycobacterium bourgelatii]